jgi:5-methylcytosine-specific restriction protein A
MTRKPLSTKTIRNVHRRKKCHLCKCKLTRFEGSIHHIIPIEKGGTNRYSNLMLLCESCHKKIHKEGGNG